MLIAGVDEVGRGPLAGDVVAAAVILSPDYNLTGLTDSKKLSEKKREALFEQIQQQAISWSLGRASVSEIDQMNILNASKLAMVRAVQGLSVVPEQLLVDGNQLIDAGIVDTQAIIQGDLTIPAISAASILAKVVRDREMSHLDMQYPGYGLAKHKGYPTKAHLQALEQLGVSPIHRKSFKPVARFLSR